MTLIKTLYSTKNLAIASFLAISLAFMLHSGSASAATLTPAAGSDSAIDDSTCTLSEAITSINDGNTTSYDECTNTGDAFGANDIINLPSGTITLTADLPNINKAVTIQGQGMGQTMIDGAGQWQAIRADLSSGDFTLARLTIKHFDTTGVQINNAETTMVSQVEIDGTGSVSTTSFMVGLGVNSDTPYDASVDLSDIYIHDFDVDATSTLQVLAAGSTGQSDASVVATRVTISNIRNTTAIQTAIFGTFSGEVNGSSAYSADVSNFTVHNIESETSMAIGLAVANIGNVDTVPKLRVTNSTIDNVTTPSGLPIIVPLIGVATAAFNPGQVANSEFTASNIVVSGAQGGSVNCGVLDTSSFVGGSGTGTGIFTSSGGNLSSDNSCKSYFTKSTDQNNVSALADTLEPLSDNGGFIPTMALKKNSPAVDAGVTVPGLTTDARLAVRPQGNAYDSGAYESPYTQPKAEEPSLAGTGESAGGAGLLAATILTLGATLAVFRQKMRA